MIRSHEHPSLGLTVETGEPAREEAACTRGGRGLVLQWLHPIDTWISSPHESVQAALPYKCQVFQCLACLITYLLVLLDTTALNWWGVSFLSCLAGAAVVSAIAKWPARAGALTATLCFSDCSGRPTYL